MRRVASLIAMTSAAAGLAAAQPFSLKLSGFSDAWLPGGQEAVLRLPADTFQEIQLRLVPPWSERIQPGDIELKLDGRYPRPTRSTGGQGHILTIRSPEVRGLLPNPEHSLEVSTPDPNLQSNWTILRWDKAYAQDSAVARDGIPVGVRLDQPPGGVVLLGGSSGTVRFGGEVEGSTEAKLTIQGERIARLASGPGFQFDAQVSVPANAKEVIVTAIDGRSNTTLVLPVRSILR